MACHIYGAEKNKSISPLKPKFSRIETQTFSVDLLSTSNSLVKPVPGNSENARLWSIVFSTWNNDSVFLETEFKSILATRDLQLSAATLELSIKIKRDVSLKFKQDFEGTESIISFVSIDEIHAIQILRDYIENSTVVVNETLHSVFEKYMCGDFCFSSPNEKGTKEYFYPACFFCSRIGESQQHSQFSRADRNINPRVHCDTKVNSHAICHITFDVSPQVSLWMKENEYLCNASLTPFLFIGLIDVISYESGNDSWSIHEAELKMEYSIDCEFIN